MRRERTHQVEWCTFNKAAPNTLFKKKQKSDSRNFRLIFTFVLFPVSFELLIVAHFYRSPHFSAMPEIIENSFHTSSLRLINGGYQRKLKRPNNRNSANLRHTLFLLFNNVNRTLKQTIDQANYKTKCAKITENILFSNIFSFCLQNLRNTMKYENELLTT